MATKQFEQKCNIQESFLSSLKIKIDNEPGVDFCTWRLSYSYMELIVCYTDKKLVNETKILESLNQEMKGEVFGQLINLRFKKKNPTYQ